MSGSCLECKYNNGDMKLGEVLCTRSLMWVKPSTGYYCSLFTEIEPPTEKQISFAKHLAAKADVELPDEFSKRAYSEFIDTWKDFR